ncbi:hypothetical protein GGR51DRAFT_557120 [Nemania sp. FL0031]|nr:hypothetical protein GGR51DRAFT_557120 [Nemania sp. FL0031]
MPPLLATLPQYSLFGRDNTPQASNTTEVVCAWAVSGQYGFGTRLLYYILITLSVLARKKEWLKNASLAAALLLPAVAAIHAIVLAAVHTDGAVDMDIYGAFQICSIGILAAPITVYNSKTYFNDPGRNIIFIWTSLLLGGMLSLTVEFFRTQTHSCPIISPFNANDLSSPFANCIDPCGKSYGPSSPIRQDPTNQAAVIPVPERLTFSAVTLLAAGSSIPPVLTLIFTWEKILEINWKRRFGQGVPREDADDPIEGTNGATPRIVTAINGAIWKFLSTIQIPIFTGVVIILLVFGEINFWSPQVTYQTEPFTSIGQWANVVATVLVVLGSLFYVQNERKLYGKDYASSNHSRDTRDERDRESMQGSMQGGSPRIRHDPVMDRNDIYYGVDGDRRLEEQRRESIELGTVTTNRTFGQGVPSIFNNRHRNSVASWLNRFADYIGTAAPDRYDNSVFREGQSEFPEIPGEAGRVANLNEIQARYRIGRQQGDGASIISISSFRNSESGPANRGNSPSRFAHPVSRSNTTPVRQNDYSAPELIRTPTSPSRFTPSSPRPRRDTLEVPEPPRPAHLRPRNSSSSPIQSPTMFLEAQGSPKIVISTEPDEASPTASSIDGPQLGPR